MQVNKIQLPAGDELQEIESVHMGSIPREQIPNLLEKTRSFVETTGIPTTDESQFNVMVRKRDDRHKSLATTQQTSARKSVIVIFIHYSCCCTDVIVLSAW